MTLQRLSDSLSYLVFDRGGGGGVKYNHAENPRLNDGRGLVMMVGERKQYFAPSILKVTVPHVTQRLSFSNEVLTRNDGFRKMAVLRSVGFTGLR